MTTRFSVICIAAALCHLGHTSSASNDEVNNLLSRVFQASNNENINQVFTVQTKDNELILESADVRSARSADGQPENTLQIIVGSTGDKPAIHTISTDTGTVEVKSKAGW
ncbi:unnamed protein product [Cylicocyclus nassatus]|uniref:Uncharacterized protein n=1 Tax=Cylicocyclus nassatus TaxID=53992 RepID=A0AA36DP33_CYLNA|nr:unnamed protein product [Cylicocyclus nassatus]